MSFNFLDIFGGEAGREVFFYFFFKLFENFEDEPVRRGFKFWDFFFNSSVANGILLCNGCEQS